jgi:hypothetical protein
MKLQPRTIMTFAGVVRHDGENLLAGNLVLAVGQGRQVRAAEKVKRGREVGVQW